MRRKVDAVKVSDMLASPAGILAAEPEMHMTARSPPQLHRQTAKDGCVQNMDRASRATEKAAEELGQASREIERAALKFQTDMDKTLPEVAAASREFHELVRRDPLLRILCN